MAKIYSLNEKTTDSEKITINLGPVDLGRVDLLVREGFYSNRTDFIRTAIRNQLVTDAEPVGRSLARHSLEMGLFEIGKKDLEQSAAKGEVLHIRVLGLARILEDVTPELAKKTIGSINVLGSLQVSNEVRTAIKDRIG